MSGSWTDGLGCRSLRPGGSRGHSDGEVKALPQVKASSGELFYLSSLLGHFQQRQELVSDPRKGGLLKQTLLSLSQHHPNQHTEHSWAHVVAGSVSERLLQVVQDPWGDGRGY